MQLELGLFGVQEVLEPEAAAVVAAVVVKPDALIQKKMRPSLEERERRAAFTGDGVVHCIEGCGRSPARNSKAIGFTLRYGGLCATSGRIAANAGHECTCGRPGDCGPVEYGISEFKATGDTSAFRSSKCQKLDLHDRRRAELGDKLCACGGKVSTQCPEGIRCDKCLRDRRNDGVPCTGPECDLPQHAAGLCSGHNGQHRLGLPLTPLGTTYTKHDYEGCALYFFRGRLSSGDMVDVFGVTERAVEARFSEYKGTRRGRPGIEIVKVHGWWRWDDETKAREVEKAIKKELAVINRSLRSGLQKESWPADDAKVRVALATIAGYAPDHTNEGDSK